MTDGAMIPTASGCSKRLSSKAAASEEARRTLRYVEPLSEARTMLADFFSILLDGIRESLAWDTRASCSIFLTNAVLPRQHRRDQPQGRLVK
jgi:hypothetical protein